MEITTNQTTSEKKSRGLQSLRLNHKKLIGWMMILIGLSIGIVSYFNDITRLEQQAKAYDNAQYLQQKIREESKANLTEQSVIEYAEETKLLNDNAEVLSDEAEARKKVIDKLFE